MPGWVPYPMLVILATGVCELAGALGLLIPRLALQPVLVWLALWVSGVTDWPFRRQSKRRDV